MEKITVEKKGSGKFQVLISGGRAPHIITLRPTYYQKLTGGKIMEEELVRQSFEFLLEREPEASILTEFDLPLIGHYFPEYEAEMIRRVAEGVKKVKS